MDSSSQVQKRTYRLPSQRSRDSVGDSTDSKPITPADELSSWLPDEMCTACGNPVSASQLYCSDQCREQEEVSATSAAADALASTHLSPKTRPCIASSGKPTASMPATTSTQRRSATDQEERLEARRFRYYCPPSPHLVAQRKTSSNGNGAPAAPSLSAFERSLLTHRSHSIQGPDSTASSNEESGSTSERRDSAASSTSSSSLGTDPSTPSPTMVVRFNGKGAAGKDKGDSNEGSEDDDNDEAELEDSDFRLPPAVTATSAVLMAQRPSTRSTERHVSDPTMTAPSRSCHSSFSPSKERGTALSTAPPMMSYARRPSSTNLPAPVLYSPALLAKGASTNKASPVSIRRRSLWNGVPAVTAGAARSRREGTHQRGPSGIEGASEVGAAGQMDSDVNASSAGRASTSSSTVEAPMKRSVSDPVPTTSPQQHSAGSASSSATRTLRAVSPTSIKSSAGVCGRPGCSGSSVAKRDSIPDQALQSASRSMTSTGIDRPAGRHRHTHSARAGLNLSVSKARDVVSPVKGLSMTPATTKIVHGSTPTGGSFVDRSRMPASGRQRDDESSQGVNDDDVGGNTQAQGRGRSKARGRRSVSRRSRSPPRAAARGRSKALLVEEVERKARNADSPPLAAVQPGSASPIAIHRRASNAGSSSGCSSSSAGEDLDRAALAGRLEGSPRRGRSPVERRRRMSTIKAGRQAAPHPAQVSSPPLRERHQSLEFAHPRLQAQQYVDPGFDDVEDLDLEL